MSPVDIGFHNWNYGKHLFVVEVNCSRSMYARA